MPVSKKKWPPSEKALCAVLVEWLEAEGWDVYQEVNFRSWCADVVAIRGSIVWVLEAKTSFSFHVMEQANRWKYYANMVSVVVPKPTGKQAGKHMAECTLRYFGIGKIEIPAPFQFKDTVEVSVNHKIFPQIYRPNGRRENNLVQRLRDSLEPEHKMWAKAGSQTGKRVTTFSLTIDRLIKAIQDKPGIALGELISSNKHHWASDAGARRYVSMYINQGVIKGARLEKRNGLLYLYPTGEENG